jgi:hypothetical protein
MSLGKNKCWYSNNWLHFLKRAVPFDEQCVNHNFDQVASFLHLWIDLKTFIEKLFRSGDTANKLSQVQINFLARKLFVEATLKGISHVACINILALSHSAEWHSAQSIFLTFTCSKHLIEKDILGLAWHREWCCFVIMPLSPIYYRIRLFWYVAFWWTSFY